MAAAAGLCRPYETGSSEVDDRLRCSLVFHFVSAPHLFRGRVRAVRKKHCANYATSRYGKANQTHDVNLFCRSNMTFVAMGVLSKFNRSAANPEKRTAISI